MISWLALFVGLRCLRFFPSYDVGCLFPKLSGPCRLRKRFCFCCTILGSAETTKSARHRSWMAGSRHLGLFPYVRTTNLAIPIFKTAFFPLPRGRPRGGQDRDHPGLGERRGTNTPFLGPLYFWCNGQRPPTTCVCVCCGIIGTSSSGLE
ncbi:hypothetical protein F5X99DRAFT_171722 [Biscogniauxia marginata]|nr:hypothetical protein F5X99DRAFT_171722 [Biscogniauxia marginata]